MEDNFKNITKFTDLIAWQEGHKLVLSLFFLLIIFFGVLGFVRASLAACTGASPTRVKMGKFVIITLFFAVLLLTAIPTSINAAYIQSKADDNDSTSQLSITFNNPVTAGSMLVVAIRIGNAGHATITSTGSPTWTEDNWLQYYGWSVGVYSAPNVPGGTTTVTATIPGSADVVRMTIHEYSGMATTAPAHKTATGTGTSGTATTGSVTTTINNCLLFCAVATDSDLLGFVAGPGYTLRANGGEKIQSEDRGPVAAGTYSGVMSLHSDTWGAILVAYAPASGGDTTPPDPPTNVTVQ